MNGNPLLPLPGYGRSSKGIHLQNSGSRGNRSKGSSYAFKIRGVRDSMVEMAVFEKPDLEEKRRGGIL
jgi:hypothetical protein